MWTRFLLMSWWERALTAASVNASLHIVGWCANGMPVNAEQPWWAPLMATAAAILTGAVVVTAFTERSHALMVKALSGVDPARQATVVAAALSGPVPSDPSLRDAAIQVNQRRLQSALLWRAIWSVLLSVEVLVLVGTVWAGRTPLWGGRDAMYLAVHVVLTLAAWHTSLDVRHRLQMLRAPVLA
ncbi:hypothetical protein BST27_13255 [Mycobacterium intermedium]|uniref:Uncharacterized protein n=1 Tax=Mycobacterium intermedium TaxID=28445 RepID=A0A1E3SMM6_MYCIE|nr:hypothetical protein [Mycobacterium intermedium]MCV6967100.1 hypothetical protein [Mycobacterium intermedium]ODR03400.1 hypothetical protein BHQ20_00740 [Mycobacterium intermedium]OPE52979.1 hypothetical protein BV508_00435 [Mycobacterium intermedium]ORB05132.1 hypothetical protein BST27_13255 [Mycobacterium intermedium]